MVGTSKVIMGEKWIMHVLEKLGIDPSTVSRVVIDAPCDDVVRFYITHYGTEELLEVRPPEANEVKIVVNA